MQNFIAQSMRRFGLAPKNKVIPTSPNGGNATPITNNPLSHMEIEGKYAYSSLSYPLDLQSRSDLGHYMMFYVNIPNESAYSTTSSLDVHKEPRGTAASTQGGEQNKAQNAILDNEEGYSKNTGQAGSFDTKGRSWKAGEQDKVIYRKPHTGLFPKMTKRTNDAITLYMPNTGITSQHSPQWAATEMGANIGEMSKTAAGMESNMWGGLPKLSANLANLMKDKLTEAVGSAAGGADLKGIRDKMSNQAENKFLETFFKGIDMRKFQFSWQFRPKSPDEVFEVQKIIKTFKFHSLPEMPERYGRFFTVPATWDIFYMYRGDENQWINKIATCVCGGVNINYSPTTWQTFRPLVGEQGAPPTEIDMQLEFMETRIITKRDVLEGF
jgi:hypothetical protein